MLEHEIKRANKGMRKYLKAFLQKRRARYLALPNYNIFFELERNVDSQSCVIALNFCRTGLDGAVIVMGYRQLQARCNGV